MDDLEPQDFADLKAAIDHALRSELLRGARDRYRLAGLSARRFRWDVLRLALGPGAPLLDRIYRYMTDPQLDAILERLVG